MPRVTTRVLVLAWALLAVGCASDDPPASDAANSAVPAVSPALDALPPLLESEGIRLVEVGTFVQPTHVSAPPGTSDLLYVAERAGIIQTVGPTGQQLALDLSADVVDEGPEQGLFSIAFPADHATSRLAYVCFTGIGDRIVVREYTATATGALDPASARDVLSIADPPIEPAGKPPAEEDDGTHNGGQIAFGPDGMLYVGVGDGGGRADPRRLGQDDTQLLGKILRIDPRPTADAAYGIPPGNAHPPGGVNRPEIYATGLRNPFRFSFTETGDLVIGDVGENAAEEIDVLPAGGAGANFGWKCFEGKNPFVSTFDVSPQPGCDAIDSVPPVVELPSSGVLQRCVALVAGFTVRDPALAPWRGQFVFADFCDGVIQLVDLRTPSPAPRRTALQVPWSSTFGEDGAGRLYVAALLSGKVYRFEAA